jgi:hypothetical protein
LEQRALSLFASAGVIGGLSGIAARSSELPIGARILFGLALVSLAAGALVGLLVAYPALVPELIESDGLRKALGRDQWERSSAEHLIRASLARLDVVDGARKVNATKASRLKIGFGCAGGGIVLLLAAAIVALWAGS